MARLSNEALAGLLLAPIVTEKTTRQAEQSRRQYAFRVRKSATKPDIRRAVEYFFEVRVEHVRVCSMHGKRRVFKGRAGRTPDWKKAYVQLQPGFKIDLVGAH